MVQAKATSSIASTLTSARLIAKKDGGVRGIATRCSLRRLVARALAKQFSSHFEDDSSRSRFVGHLLRVATEASPTATVLSVDGIGAFDHVLRSAMLCRLEEMVEAKALLPVCVVVPRSNLQLLHFGSRLSFCVSFFASPKGRILIDVLSRELWPDVSGETNFGPTKFGLAVLQSFWPNQVWPAPILAEPSLASTNFGQTEFGQCQLGSNVWAPLLRSGLIWAKSKNNGRTKNRQMQKNGNKQRKNTNNRGGTNNIVRFFFRGNVVGQRRFSPKTRLVSV